MPTRVVLRDSAASTGAGRRRAVRRETVDDFAMRPTLTPPSRISTTSPNARPSVQRSISVNFRTALRDDDEESETFREAGGALTDIRGSPRLMGYLSCGLASAVNLVSVMQFWAKEGTRMSPSFEDFKTRQLMLSSKTTMKKTQCFARLCLSPS